MADPNEGRKATVEISADGNTYYAIGGVTSANWDPSVKEIDITDTDSGAFEEMMPGRMSAKCDVDANFEEGDAGQALVTAAFMARAKKYWRIRPTAGSGYVEHKGQGYVTGAPEAIPGEKQVTFKFTVKMTGAFTSTAQA